MTECYLQWVIKIFMFKLHKKHIPTHIINGNIVCYNKYIISQEILDREYNKYSNKVKY